MDKSKQIQKFLETRADEVEPSSLKKIGETLKQFGKHLGKKSFKQATPEDVQSFIRKYSQSCFNPFKSALTMFYRWLYNLEDDERLPECVRMLKSRKSRAIRKQGKEIKIRERLITPEEYQLLIAHAINPYQKAIIEALWLLGPRISELLSMRATDIIETENITKVILRDSKTQPREVPIQETPQYLLEWYHTYQPYKKDKTKPLWASPYGKDTFQTIKREAVLKMIQRTARKAGITKKITNHDFRHTAISRDLANGMPQSLVESKYGLVHGSDMIQTYDHNGNVQLEEYYNKRPIDTPETRLALERKYKRETEENKNKIDSLEKRLEGQEKTIDKLLQFIEEYQQSEEDKKALEKEYHQSVHEEEQRLLRKYPPHGRA